MQIFIGREKSKNRLAGIENGENAREDLIVFYMTTEYDYNYSFVTRLPISTFTPCLSLSTLSFCSSLAFLIPDLEIKTLKAQSTSVGSLFELGHYDIRGQFEGHSLVHQPLAWRSINFYSYRLTVMHGSLSLQIWIDASIHSMTHLGHWALWQGKYLCTLLCLFKMVYMHGLMMLLGHQKVFCHHHPTAVSK